MGDGGIQKERRKRMNKDDKNVGVRGWLGERKISNERQLRSKRNIA